MTKSVALTRTTSVAEELDQVHQQIRRRAYELFRSNGAPWSIPLEYWLKAEREIVWHPAVEMCQKDGCFEVRVAMAGVEPGQFDVEVTPEDLLVRGRDTHDHCADTGTVHICEFSRGQLFRSIHFPTRVDPSGVSVEYRHGLLRVTAPIAVGPRKIERPVVTEAADPRP